MSHKIHLILRWKSLSQRTLLNQSSRNQMTDFEIPPVLEEMIPDGSLIHKHLPKQADIDKSLTQINRKYLRRMHLPCSLKDMQATYMQSPHFCDIYNAIMFKKYPKQYCVYPHQRLTYFWTSITLHY